MIIREEHRDPNIRSMDSTLHFNLAHIKETQHRSVRQFLQKKREIIIIFKMSVLFLRNIGMRVYYQTKLLKDIRKWKNENSQPVMGGRSLDWPKQK